MKNKKFVLTDETMKFHGILLHRIKAVKNFADVKKGDLGGWVENESNLSQEGDCWLYDDAKAFNRARVYGKNRYYGRTIICNFANVVLYDSDAKVY